MTIDPRVSAALSQAVVLRPMTPLDLAKLSRKYQLIAALREGVGVLSAAQAREPLRALSREFPGALREVDVLSVAVLERRRTELSTATEPYALWMRAVHAYHQIMALSLWLKVRLGRHTESSSFEQLAAEASQHHALTCDAAWVAAVASPPGGRLNRLVFGWLAAQVGLAAADVPGLLFPRGAHAGADCSHTESESSPSDDPGERP